jgi:predicted RNase H-like nuclease (RuvC/YqgF family)
MKYRYVRVGKTKSYGFYQNASIDLEVELEKGEQPELIVKQLNEEVEKLLDQIIQSQEITEVREDISRLEQRRNELQNEVDKLSDEVYSKKELLSRLATIAVLVKDLESKEEMGQ